VTQYHFPQINTKVKIKTRHLRAYTNESSSYVRFFCHQFCFFPKMLELSNTLLSESAQTVHLVGQSTRIPGHSGCSSSFNLLNIASLFGEYLMSLNISYVISGAFFNTVHLLMVSPVVMGIYGSRF